MKFNHSNKFDLCYYGQVNSLRLKLLKSSVASKWASKHLWGCHLFCWRWYITDTVFGAHKVPLAGWLQQKSKSVRGRWSAPSRAVMSHGRHTRIDSSKSHMRLSVSMPSDTVSVGPLSGPHIWLDWGPRSFHDRRSSLLRFMRNELSIFFIHCKS